MTNDELEELLVDCPRLYHMAAGGSWNSIRKSGLLSTSALLDRLDVSREARAAIEDARRAESVVIEDKSFGRVVIRDNKPMDDAGLARALAGHMSPAEWYHLLNQQVFFWLTRDRLERLLTAGSYVNDQHDVLEVDTRMLVAAHREEIMLCPMNSGCTKPFPHPRGPETFSSIAKYPYGDWRAKRKRGERVVELTVRGGVPDIEEYVLRVNKMRGTETLELLFER